METSIDKKCVLGLIACAMVAGPALAQGASDAQIFTNTKEIKWTDAPPSMPKGAKVHCIAHFDNSAKNLNNPDPTQTVTWGDQTWQEMMIGWTDFAYPIRKKD